MAPATPWGCNFLQNGDATFSKNACNFFQKKLARNTSKFYDNQEELIVEDTFRDVILKYGAFDSCYFDYPDVLTIPKFCVAA